MGDLKAILISAGFGLIWCCILIPLYLVLLAPGMSKMAERRRRDRQGKEKSDG